MDLYSEAGRNIHRVVAVILATTTWVAIKEIIPDYYIVGCFITAALEYSAYKTISNNAGRRSGFFHAAVAITIASSLFSLASGFVIEASITGKATNTAVEQSEIYARTTSAILSANANAKADHASDQEKALTRIDAQYDSYQAQIGTAWWKREFAKNPDVYRRDYDTSTGPGRWIVQRDSLERARDKAKAEVLSTSAALAELPADFSSTTLQAGEVLAGASRYTIIIVDIFCLLISIGVISNKSDEAPEDGITDAILLIPILAGKAINRAITPVVVEEERRDAELEEELLEQKAEIERLKREADDRRRKAESERRQQEAAARTRQEAKPVAKPVLVAVTKDGRLKVGERLFKNKKSLQTALSRARGKGDAEEIAKLNSALEEYSTRHFPQLSSPGGN